MIASPLCLPLEANANGGRAMSSFSLYLLGILVLIAGLAYVAWLMHAPLQWIGAGVIVVFGLGILGAVKHTQRRDPPK
jgi:Flp pilus assembly protein TadB